METVSPTTNPSERPKKTGMRKLVAVATLSALTATAITAACTCDSDQDSKAEKTAAKKVKEKGDAGTKENTAVTAPDDETSTNTKDDKLIKVLESLQNSVDQMAAQRAPIDTEAAMKKQKELCDTSFNYGATTDTFGPLAKKVADNGNTTFVNLCSKDGDGELLKMGSTCKQDSACTEKGQYEDWQVTIGETTYTIADTDDSNANNRDPEKPLPAELSAVCWQAGSGSKCEEPDGYTLAVAVKDDKKKAKTSSKSTTGIPRAPQPTVSRTDANQNAVIANHEARIDNLEGGQKTLFEILHSQETNRSPADAQHSFEQATRK